MTKTSLRETTNVFQDSSTFDLQISNPAALLNEIARRYESSERILMEFVDNALDDVEPLYRANARCLPV